MSHDETLIICLRAPKTLKSCRVVRNVPGDLRRENTGRDYDVSNGVLFTQVVAVVQQRATPTLPQGQVCAHLVSNLRTDTALRAH